MGAELTLGFLFPDYKDRVFADWFSGTLRCPIGKQLRYVHSEFESVYERDLVIEVRRGIVIDQSERGNTIITVPTADHETNIPRFLRHPA